jgi:gliding motility-associated lipoprotein GldH
MLNMRISLFLFGFLFLLQSCESPAFYNKSYAFKGNKWSQDVKPSYVIDFKDTVTLYDFVITLRTTTDYKYNNLWVFLNTTPPNGKSLREPYEIKTTYPDGSWIGKKTGTVVEHQLVFKRRRLPYKGKYKFVVEQAITEKTVDEVLDISLRVEEVKE